MSIKKFFRLVRKYLGGFRLHRREEQYLNDFLNNTPLEELERILRRHVHKIDIPTPYIDTRKQFYID